MLYNKIDCELTGCFWTLGRYWHCDKIKTLFLLSVLLEELRGNRQGNKKKRFMHYANYM